MFVPKVKVVDEENIWIESWRGDGGSITIHPDLGRILAIKQLEHTVFICGDNQSAVIIEAGSDNPKIISQHSHLIPSWMKRMLEEFLIDASVENKNLRSKSKCPAPGAPGGSTTWP